MTPPKNFHKFFRWFCAPEYFEELEGDLEESFHAHVREHGITFARKKYRKEVLLLMRPSVIKKFNLNIYPSRSSAMFRNYLKISFRNLRRHSLFSFINISGLAIAMSVGLLIIAMVSDLLRFDEFHEKKDRIYRVISEVQYGPYSPQHHATCVLPLADEIKQDYAGIEEVVRIKKDFVGGAEVNDKALFLSGHYVDPTFTQVFDFEWVAGDPARALLDPFTMAITEPAAKRLFGSQDPMGQIVDMGELGNYQITGLIQELPKYSHLQFEMLGSMASVVALEKQGVFEKRSQEWDAFWNHYVYLLLEPGHSPQHIQAGLESMAQKHYTPEDDVKANFELQALSAIVPGKDLSNQIGPKMMFLPIYILSGLALLILLSACFNYANLSIARSLKRATEVGVRKVVGASRRQIFSQFITESVVISVLALLLSGLIFKLIRPEFMSVIPHATEMFDMLFSVKMGLAFLAFAIFAGIIAGLFPAWFLSRMEASRVLKSISSFTLFKGLRVRKVLTVFQFTLSLVFILGMTIIYRQYQFSINHDMGFDQANILDVSLQGNDPQIVSDALLQLPEVTKVSASSLIPGVGWTSQAWAQIPNTVDSMLIFQMSVDTYYLENLNISLKTGSNFPTDISGEKEQYIIVNEQFVKMMGLGDAMSALGKVVEIKDKNLQVLGVVHDFHYNHLEEPIESFCFRYRPEDFSHLNVKIASNDMQASMEKIEAAWKNIDPKHEFSSQFFDQHIEEAYGYYTQIMKMFGFMAFLAISIACLGLLGMAVFTVETKVKEIGIRKMMGASEKQLVYLLSKGFVKLLLISALIAAPLAYFFFDRVLLNIYAYRISIGFWEIGLGVAFVLLLGGSIIASQTLMAARMNPAESLRNE